MPCTTLHPGLIGRGGVEVGDLVVCGRFMGVGEESARQYSISFNAVHNRMRTDIGVKMSENLPQLPATYSCTIHNLIRGCLPV